MYFSRIIETLLSNMATLTAQNNQLSLKLFQPSRLSVLTVALTASSHNSNSYSRITTYHQ